MNFVPGDPITPMRTFEELSNAKRVLRANDCELGPVYWTHYDGHDGGRVILFDNLDDIAPYVGLHEYAHIWVHRHYEYDAWWMIDVDEPIEVGVDFVSMPRRIGNTLHSFVQTEDQAVRPDRFAEVYALIPKLVAAADNAADKLVAEMVASRFAKPDGNTIYVWREYRFYIQDLAPSREELSKWQAVPHDE